MKRVLLGIGVVAMSVYLGTGIVVIQPDEQGVVRRLGRVSPELLAPGLRFELPWGLARTERVKPAETKQLSVGVTVPGDELRSGASAMRA